MHFFKKGDALWCRGVHFRVRGHISGQRTIVILFKEQSLSASGKPYDNAVAESFFSIIKKKNCIDINIEAYTTFKNP